MFNRRQLLIGSAATAAVLSTPAILQAATPDRSVLDSVLKVIERHRGWHSSPPEQFDLDIKINTRLIMDRPDLFSPDRHIYSGCPTNIFADASDDRAAYCVASRSFGTRYSMELAQDLRSIYGMDAEEEFTRVVTAELAVEIAIRQAKLRFHGHTMFSYFPVYVSRAINPDTFVPEIGFVTRYAAVPEGFRYINHEEERAITLRKNREYLASLA